LRIDLDDGRTQLLDLLVGLGRKRALLRDQRDPRHVQRDEFVTRRGLANDIREIGARGQTRTHGGDLRLMAIFD